MVDVIIKNQGRHVSVADGSTLEEIYRQCELRMQYGPISARVNNKVEGLHYRVFSPRQIEYLDLHSSSGSRAYTRSLFMVLCKAVSDLYPTGHVVIDIPVSNGYYCDLHIGQPVTDDVAAALRRRMAELVAANLPIHRMRVPTESAIEQFASEGRVSKVKLLRSYNHLYTTIYTLDGFRDYYYGAMLPRTGLLHLYGLEKYYDGLLLRIPSQADPSRLGELVMQPKMFDIFREHHRWQNILGMSTIGDLNEAIDSGKSALLINVSEALQEKKIAQIADRIAAQVRQPASGHQPVRLVLLAGPSSSGKTTTCKRLSVQLLTNSIKPVPISLDDYFLDRDKTPRDEHGDYDFESIHALNLPLLNEQMQALFRGDEVELPRYDFPTGRSMRSGRRLRLHDDEVLVVEGIHALNPELTKSIPEQQKFRVYASALTTLLLDSHNYIPTTDNRLLRRIVRDHKYRGTSAQETIRRWPSVRAGENRWIFPYQEMADAMFNTAMLFELAVLKTQVEPLLEQVPENSVEYAEAYRLRKLLSYVRPTPADQLPPTSLLREFLGGSTFKY
ncbi:MAG: nucleoside kinase [Prevotella sp.]|nr:nucleoside kinase [Prevotella sp.]